MVIQRITRRTTNFKKLVTGSFIAFFGVAIVGAIAVPTFAANGGGFNEFGYNYNARVFSGPADGVDKLNDGMVWGDPTYANDHLVMKWNAAWDACNANGYDNPAYCAGAWDTNEWNGMLPNGSKYTEHVKIIWVGSAAELSKYWVEGGTSIWGNYEVILDKGMNPDHTQYLVTFATPNGLGQTKNN